MDGSLVENIAAFYPTFVQSGLVDPKDTICPDRDQHQLKSFSDFSVPTFSWYLIRSFDDPGTAYFIGYETASGLMGYLTSTDSPSDTSPKSWPNSWKIASFSDVGVQSVPRE